MDSKPDSRVENKDCYDDYFRKGLKSDFDLIQLVLLLIQKSLPIKNIDILWHHSLLPHKLSFPNRLGTKDALVQLESEPVAPLTKIDPNPRFCNLVNDFGRQEGVSCARSDLPAEAKARLTRKPQVYTCHAGLIDICVPIFAGDQYLGCIFCGQVLTRHPAKQDFKEAWKKVADLSYLKKDELQEAYFEVPVVGKDDLDVIVKILTTFADYLASSWQRLQQLLESERQRHAELSLRQQEFASLLLNGEILNLSQLEREAHDLGFVEVPTNVLVIEIGNPRSGEQVNQLLLDPDHTRAFTLLSKIAEKRPNTLVSSLRRYEFVCFTSPGCNRNPAHSRLLVRELAQDLRNAALPSEGQRKTFLVCNILTKRLYSHLAIEEEINRLSSTRILAENSIVQTAFWMWASDTWKEGEWASFGRRSRSFWAGYCTVIRPIGSLCATTSLIFWIPQRLWLPRGESISGLFVQPGQTGSRDSPI